MLWEASGPVAYNTAMFERKTMPERVLLCFMVVSIALLAGCNGSSSSDNIVLITVDTLRPDRLGCYGYALETSPSIDRMAAGSIVFENAFAQASTTCPSLAAVMTSRLPAESGVRHNRNMLRKDIPTLAEILEKEGYTTAAFVSNYVLRKGMGFERGFDVFNDDMTTKELNRHLTERVAADTVRDVLEWLDDKPREPFFLWVHFQDPHGPYTPPDEYNDMFLDRVEEREQVLPFNTINTGVAGIPMYQRIEGVFDQKTYAARYLGEIRYFDDSFGRLYDRLRQPDLAGSTITAFTADHGESLGEHDYYFAHGEYLYNHQIRVPLILQLPGRSGERVEDPVALVDLLPTLLALAGVEAPGGIRGVDLLDPLGMSRPIFSQTAKTKFIRRDRLSLIWNGYKLIYTEPGGTELFNLADDPAEKNNLAEKEPEKAEILRKELLRQNDAFIRGEAVPMEIDEDTRKRLEGLGY